MRPFPAATTGRVVLGASAWSLSILFFIGQGIAQSASARPYSLAANLISDLGVTACGPFSIAGFYQADICSPLYGLMNGTFVAAGLLQLVAVIGTWPAWPRRRLTSAGLVLVALAGADLVVAGFVPMNVGLTLHTLCSLSGVLFANVAMILLGLAVLPAVRWLGAAALVAGIAGLVGFVLFESRTLLPAGAAERLAIYPAVTMAVVFGVYLLGSALTERRRHGPVQARMA